MIDAEARKQIKELKSKIEKLEQVVAQLVANETNRQWKIKTMQEFEDLRDQSMSEIGHDM